MLDCYLDIKAAGNFDELFKGTEIHHMKREHNNKYYVMRLDLSVDIGMGDLATVAATIEERLHTQILVSIIDFCRRYSLDLNELRLPNVFATLQNVVKYVQESLHGKTFFLIDEYDRFANKLMFENPDAYNKIGVGRTEDALSSPLRALFESIKSLRVRSFTVGLSPIALADASGVNFMSDISDNPEVGDMLGLTEVDLRSALTDIFGSVVDIEPFVSLMKRFYNGYHYRSQSSLRVTPPLYHTQLCLFFFRKLCRDEEFREKAVAGTLKLHEMIDMNTQVSDHVITLMILQNEFAGIICQLADGESVHASIVPTFKLREILSERSSPDLLVSFMRWHGLVTMSSAGTGMYNIPNQVVGNAKGLLYKVVDAMPGLQFNVRAVINEPSKQKAEEMVWGMHQAAFANLDTRFDGFFSEGAVVGILEAILKRQGKREGFDVFCDKRREGLQQADLMLVDRISKRILLLEYKRLRPETDFTDSDLCLKGGGKAKLSEATTVSGANEQLLRFDISERKWGYPHKSKTVLELLGKAKIQVSGYSGQIMRMSEYSSFTITTGVVIHATTKDGSHLSETFTSVVGVWLQ